MRNLIVYIESNKKPVCYDQMNLDTGISRYGKETLQDVQSKCPSASLMTLEEYQILHDQSWTTEPKEITQEQYLYALNVLPPFKWFRSKNHESFKMSEMLSGCITGIYCRVGKRYFHFNGDISTPHDEVISKCANFADIEVNQ